MEQWSWILLTVALSAGLLISLSSQNVNTPAIDSSESIAILEEVEIGGVEQWLLMRGEDRSDPVLLWLHGGPGSSLMPASWYFDRKLEKDFIVVHWDQRGSGKSNSWHFDYEELTLEQYVQDANEVTAYLKQRLDKDKIYIIGYSWGSRFGLRLAERYPEDYFALISLGQVVSPMRDHVVTYRRVMEKASQQSNEKDIERLETLGTPPFTEHADYTVLREMAQQYGGGTDYSFIMLGWLGIQSSEYRLRDYILFLKGYLNGLKAMWEESITFNAFSEAARLELPVYFLIGAKDLYTPIELVREYYEFLDAPMGKELIVFEDSGHAPFMSEPEKFHQELLRIKQETHR